MAPIWLRRARPAKAVLGCNRCWKLWARIKNPRQHYAVIAILVKIYLTEYEKSPYSGAGLVVKPMVEFLLEKGFSVMIATTTREKADLMIKDHPAGSSLRWSSDDVETLEKLYVSMI